MPAVMAAEVLGLISSSFMGFWSTGLVRIAYKNEGWADYHVFNVEVFHDPGRCPTS
jgi:hypothetical protein